MKFSTIVWIWAILLVVVFISVIGHDSSAHTGVGLGPPAMLLLMVGGYFFPAIIASLRKHRNLLAIFMLTLFLGWTGLGWIMALVWACTNNSEAAA
jgi:Superinfection immunity protein